MVQRTKIKQQIFNSLNRLLKKSYWPIATYRRTRKLFVSTLRNVSQDVRRASLAQKILLTATLVDVTLKVVWFNSLTTVDLATVSLVILWVFPILHERHCG